MTLEEIKIRAGAGCICIVDTELIEAAKSLKNFANHAFVGWGNAAMAKAEEEMKDSYTYLVKDYLDLLVAGATEIEEIEDNNDDEK